MLYRMYGKRPQVHIGAGALCLATGILLERLSRGVDWSAAGNASFWTGDFMHGFLAGLSTTLMVASILFILIGFRKMRQEKAEGCG